MKLIEERIAKLVVTKGGSGSSTFRATLPAKWIREMGLDEESRELLLSFDGKRIIIENKEEMEMKAKVYEGIKLMIKQYEGDKGEKINTLCRTVEEFKNANDENLYGDEKIEKIDDVLLYRVDTAKADSLSELYNIREKWDRRKQYRYLMTLEEIEEYLENDYLVAVEGVGEISSIDEIK